MGTTGKNETKEQRQSHVQKHTTWYQALGTNFESYCSVHQWLICVFYQQRPSPQKTSGPMEELVLLLAIPKLSKIVCSKYFNCFKESMIKKQDINT